MTSKPFDIIEHLEPLCRWLYQRGAFIPTKQEIPQLGLVISDDTSLIAMGFLRSVEGNMAIWDGMATNPERSAEDRHDALDLLMTRLIEIAAHAGTHKIIAWTGDSNSQERALSHGFKAVPSETLLVLNRGA